MLGSGMGIKEGSIIYIPGGAVYIMGGGGMMEGTLPI